MTLSPAFTARMMKEQKMFSFNPPPGSGHAFPIYSRRICLACEGQPV